MMTVSMGLGAAVDRVLTDLQAVGRSECTSKRHRAVLNRFIGFVQARGLVSPGEADCLDFIAERTGVRLAGLREPSGERAVQLERRPLLLLMTVLVDGSPRVGQRTSPLTDRCPVRFRDVRDQYLESCRQRGNAEATAATKDTAVSLFLEYLGQVGHEDLGGVSGMDLAGFWSRQKSYRSKTVGTRRSALADFLRYAHERGLVVEDLSVKLPAHRNQRSGQSLPFLWSADDLRKVLDVIDRRSAIGKRDYAMILLTARLGLRVGDLRRLQLGWLDWRSKTLTLTQHKTGRELTLPLLDDVGWAVIDYIRHGRPESDCPQVFIKHRWPFTAFGSSTSLGCRLRYYSHRAGIVFGAGQWHGLHSLRGALAVAMLDGQAPLPVVSATLGHASTDTTAGYYLRLDVERLRLCALDAEDVLAQTGR